MKYRLDQLSLLALVLLAVLLPFELEAPWLHLGPIAFTNVELMLGLVLILAAILWQQRLRPSFGLPTTWVLLGCLFIVALVLSSLLAPEFRTNALKATFRTLSGIALALATSQIVRSRRAFLWVAAGIVTGGLLASLIGLIEVAFGSDFAWLKLFRAIPTRAGPYLRLAGPFDYANQAAMFIEATLPLLVGFAWSAYENGRRALAGTLVGSILVYLQAGALTYSRSNFATIFVVALIVGAFLWLKALFVTTRQQKRQSYPWWGSAAAVVLLILVNTAVSPGFRLRLTTEGDNEWYQARLQVPQEFGIEANKTLPVQVTMTNEGAFIWRSTGKNPIHLVARWNERATNQEWAIRPKWALPAEVSPGETLTVTVPVKAPKEGGEYELFWDLAQENIVWFEAKHGITTRSLVTVEGGVDEEIGAADVEIAWVEPTDYLPPIPGRRTLWNIGLHQFQNHPLLGIGLDNFRLTYGRELGYEEWEESVHTNSWYLEMLVSLGVVGSLPFFAWLTLLVFDLAQTCRRQSVTLWQIAVAAGLLAYLIHGLLDYFLLFNATGLLFWLLIGLWISQKTVTQKSRRPSV